MPDEVKITYSTLFDLLMREKNREELQQLDPSFYNNVVEYLKEKKEISERKKQRENVFDFEDTERIDAESNNVRKIIRELYERREKKITIMAISTSRTSANIIDTSNMLPHELNLYQELLNTLSAFRKNILYATMDLNLHQQAEKKETPAEAESEPETATPKDESSIPSGKRILRFTAEIPEFMGSDLETYGPYKPGEVADIPEDVAEILVGNGSAEEVVNSN